MTPKRSQSSFFIPIIIIILIAAALGGAYWYLFLSGSSRSGSYTGALFTVTRRDLVINVLEGGSLQSANAHEIKSQAEGRNTVISLIPDGTILTDEDVKNGRILMELDSSSLTEKEAQQEITFQSAQADHIQATESFEIQKKQNESNITAGQLTVKFSRMDFARYLGADLASRILKSEVKLSAFSLSNATSQQAAKALEALKLGGQARKEWQKLQSDIDLAEEKVKRAHTDYGWSLTLGPKDPKNPDSAGKGYISQSDVDADKLQWQAAVADAAQAKLARDIFLKYDLPKEAEKLNSDYAEAQRELDRIHAKARAELAQAKSKMKAKEAAFNLQTTRLKKLRKQIKNCTIRATKPGMIVYASTTDRRGSQTDVIELGAQVRERQVLFRIPDPSSMTIKVNVNEASVSKIKRGQKVRVIAEPFPEQTMWGTVKKVSETPDPQHRWLAPDTQTYTTEIDINDPPLNLKPGMSAKAEIIIDRIENVLAVPIQAVSMLKGVRVCYVMQRGSIHARPVEIGQADNSFIEITAGLKAGEQVLLTKPEPETADETLVTAAAAKQKNKAATETRKAAKESRNAAAPAKTEPQNDTAKTDKLPDYINKIPEQYRQRIIEQRNALSPEERKEFDRKRRARISQGGNQSSGNRRPKREGGN